MTTIVFRDGVLAADRLRTAGSMRDGETRKVWKTSKGELVGACGSTAICESFRDWVKAGMCGESPFHGKKDSGNGLVVWPNGQMKCWGSEGPWAVRAPFYSLGTGYEIALGALQMGADAAKAVRCAIKHDTASGGKVDTVQFKGKVKR